MKQKQFSSHRYTHSTLIAVLCLSLLINGVLLYQSYRSNIVTSVPDGDSLQLSSGQRIRLLGIDAPERDMCMARDARLALERAARGKHVRLKHTVTDDYGRTLANVIVEDLPTWISYMKRWIKTVIASPKGVALPAQAGIPSGSLALTRDDEYVDPLLNRLMVSRGLAKYIYVKSPYSDELKKYQSISKTNKLGIWSDTCRKTSNPDCDIKGNTRGSQKIYHLPGCKNYDQTIIDTSFGDAWFCSEKEAIATGFTKSTGCL